ncbi:MAG: RNA polymerase sigma factor [Chloroflexi bacterium]|nr:RNA polymerase sigma factor [Chloroflexota bacterium]
MRATDTDIRLAQRGDAAAFERLAGRQLTGLYRIAGAMVGEEDGRDVVQETLVTAWRELPRLRRVDRFESWLRSICMNRCRNLLRTRSRRPSVLAGLDLSSLPGLRADDPMARLHSDWATDDMLEVLRPDERAVFVLHYVDDRSLREIAGILDMKPGTVKTKLHAGLRRLRDAVASEGAA